MNPCDKTPRPNGPIGIVCGLAACAWSTATGCTPEEQQALLQQISGLVGDTLSELVVMQAMQLVTLVTSFARSGLAAFLF
jgi:hypothetical protein